MSIRLTGIVKSFRTNTVLNDLSLTVATGETLALLGPSGAGKTVLLRLIAGVIDPDAGQIAIDDVDMEGVEPEHRGIGMAFQNFALFPHMDAYANIASPLEARRESAAGIRRRVSAVARLLKIDHVLDHKPAALSNGQKQRTALGRALVAEPSILLLDDPFRNIDARLRFEMRLELPRLLKARETTVIHVTQDYREAMALGDRIAVMGSQGIVQIGTPEEIYTTPGNVRIARLFGDPAINLLDVVPQGDVAGTGVRLSGIMVPLGLGYAQAIGHDCILGIRPEAIRFTTPDTLGAFPVRIEAETPLNEKTVTLATTRQQQEILISRPAGTAAPDRGTTHVAIDTARVLLFHRTTGARIGQGESGWWVP